MTPTGESELEIVAYVTDPINGVESIGVRISGLEEIQRFIPEAEIQKAVLGVLDEVEKVLFPLVTIRVNAENKTTRSFAPTQKDIHDKINELRHQWEKGE